MEKLEEERNQRIVEEVPSKEQIRDSVLRAIDLSK